MANIDELHFGVILDDNGFKEQLEEMEALANKLNVDLTKLLEVRAKASSVSASDVKNTKRLNEILASNAKAEERIRREKERTESTVRKLLNLEESRRRINESDASTREATNQAKMATAITNKYAAQERLNKALGTTTGEYKTQARLLKEMSAMMASYVSAYGAVSLVKNLVRVSAEFELQRTTLRAILQDVEQADVLFSNIKELAVKSPFQFKELATYAKQLSAYSIPVNELYDTTKMLADVSAGLGVGMDRLVLAYGQIRSASFLRGQEVRQLTEAGIPILEELRKQFEELNGEVLTAGDVFDKISTRQVPFEMVAKVFKNMTSEGGKFYQMQEVQAETLKGKISNLVDAYEIMFSEIGEKNDSFLKGGVDTLRKMIDNYEKLGNAIVILISAFGAYKAMMLSLQAIRWFTDVQRYVNDVRRLGQEVGVLSVAMQKLGISKASLALGGTMAAITALVVGISQAVKKAHELDNSLQKLKDTKFNEADTQVRKFTELVDALRNAEQGSEAYREAISRLNNQYGDYLPHLLDEKNALKDILEQSDLVVASIYNRAKAYAYEEGSKQIESDYVEKSSKALKRVSGEMVTMGKNTEQVNNFLKVFRSNVLSSTGYASDVFKNTWKNFFGEELNNKSLAASVAVASLAKSFRDTDVATKSLNNSLDILFSGQSFTTSKEADDVKKITDKYTKLREELKNTRMEQSAYIKKLNELDRQEISEMIDLYEQLSAEDGGTQARTDKLKQYYAQLEKVTKEVKGWGADVNNILKGMGLDKNSSGGMWAEDTDGLLDYMDRVRKFYKALTNDGNMKALELNENDNYKKLMKQKEAVEAIAKALNFSLDEGKTGKGGSKEKSDLQIALEAQVDSVKRLMALYEQMKQMGISDATAKEWFAAFAPDTTAITNTLSFRDALESYAKTLENVYEDTKGAQAIRDLFSKDDIKAAMDAYSKLEALRGKLQSWIAEDFNISGEGIIFDLNKLASELNTKNNRVDNNLQNLKLQFKEAVGNEEAIKAIREKYGEEAWMAYIDAGENALDILAQREKEYNKRKTEENIRDMAKNYIKEWDALKAFDLSDWSTKSVTELKDIQAAIDSFDPTRLPQRLRNLALELGGQEGLDKVIEVIVNELDKLSAKTDEQLKKDKIEQVKKLAGYVGDVAGSASNLSSVLGNSALTKSFDMMEDLAKSVGSIYESIAEGKYAEAAIGSLAAIFQLAVSVIEASQEAQQAIKDAKMEARAYNAEIALSSGVDSIFGENAIKSIRNAVSEINRLGKAVDEDKKKITLMNAAFNASTGILTLGNRKVDLKKEVEKLGYELYDANGNLNSKALQALLDTYDGLNKASKEWLQNAIKDSEEYADALAQLEQEVSNIFGNLADDMASSFIDKYMEIGDATADLANQMDNIFGDLAKNIANELVSAFILDNVLSKYEGEAKSMMERMASGDADETEIAQYFSTLADGIKNDTEAAAEYTNRLLDALTAQGITLGSDSETSNSLSNGIKSITEDTANLLASYVNAIRADVAASRVSLTDIQTNTFRSAIAAEGILSKIESVMGSFSGGGDGIKVVVQ